MRLRRIAFVFAVVLLLAPVSIPAIRFDTNVSPPCARAGGPCPLPADSPMGIPVFWSLTAYYFGVGAYITPNGYGFIGFPLLFLMLLAKQGVFFLLDPCKAPFPELFKRLI